MLQQLNFCVYTNRFRAVSHFQIPMFLAMLFIIGKKEIQGTRDRKGKPPKWKMYTPEYYSPFRRQKILQQATA